MLLQALGQAWEDNGLVFPKQLGRPIEKQNLLLRSFRPVLERAGLPHIRFHDLRQTAATLLLAQGVHPKVVQEQVGSAKESGASVIFITHNIYHAYPVADRFVVLDKGVKIADVNKEETTAEDIIEMVATGKNVEGINPTG